MWCKEGSAASMSGLTRTAMVVGLAQLVLCPASSPAEAQPAGQRALVVYIWDGTMGPEPAQIASSRRALRAILTPSFLRLLSVISEPHGPRPAASSGA